jgi:hypothetical protein
MRDDELAAVERLQRLAEVPLPPEVRERHLLAIRTTEPVEGAGRTSSPSRGWRRAAHVQRRLVPVAAASLALVLVAGGGTVALAGNAVPEDALYGVKRTAEQVWVAVPRGSQGAAELQLTLAGRRLAEAERAPAHAERLVAEGLENAEAAAEELPEEAIESLSRLLGDGEGRLPDRASPRARSALHRNCVRIAEKHGLDVGPCGEAPPDEHPGGGKGLGHGRGQGMGPGTGVGPKRDGSGHPGRGWGPGGRPPGVVGPPPAAGS